MAEIIRKPGLLEDIKMTGITAAESVADPFGLLPPLKPIADALKVAREKKREYIQKSGGSTTGAEIAGTLLGLGPAYVKAAGLGLKGASALSKAKALSKVGDIKKMQILGKAAKAKHKARAFNTIQKKAEKSLGRTLGIGADATLDMAYETATAVRRGEDQPLLEGFKGVAIGAAIGVPIVYSGQLRRALRSGSKLTEEQADLVSKAMRTKANVEAPPSSSLGKATPINFTIPHNAGQVMEEAVKSMRGAGVPLGVVEDARNPGVRIIVESPQGKRFQVGGKGKGLSLGDLDQLVGKVDHHLQRGASIAEITGDPYTIRRTLLTLEDKARELGKLDVEDVPKPTKTVVKPKARIEREKKISDFMESIGAKPKVDPTPNPETVVELDRAAARKAKKTLPEALIKKVEDAKSGKLISLKSLSDELTAAKKRFTEPDQQAWLDKQMEDLQALTVNKVNKLEKKAPASTAKKASKKKVAKPIQKSAAPTIQKTKEGLYRVKADPEGNLFESIDAAKRFRDNELLPGDGKVKNAEEQAREVAARIKEREATEKAVKAPVKDLDDFLDSMAAKRGKPRLQADDDDLVDPSRRQFFGKSLGGMLKVNTVATEATRQLKTLQDVGGSATEIAELTKKLSAVVNSIEMAHSQHGMKAKYIPELGLVWKRSALNPNAPAQITDISSRPLTQEHLWGKLMNVVNKESPTYQLIEDAFISKARFNASKQTIPLDIDLLEKLGTPKALKLAKNLRTLSNYLDSGPIEKFSTRSQTFSNLVRSAELQTLDDITPLIEKTEKGVALEKAKIANDWDKRLKDVEKESAEKAKQDAARQEAYRKKLADDMAKKEKIRNKLLSDRVDKKMRPTGMELVKTHLALGEDGKAGQMLRFSADANNTQDALDRTLASISQEKKLSIYKDFVARYFVAGEDSKKMLGMIGMLRRSLTDEMELLADIYDQDIMEFAAKHSGEMKIKQTGLIDYHVGDQSGVAKSLIEKGHQPAKAVEYAKGVKGAQQMDPRTGRPNVWLVKDKWNRTTKAHEEQHALISATGMRPAVDQVVKKHSLAHDLIDHILGPTYADYSHKGEELFVTLLGHLRGGGNKYRRAFKHFGDDFAENPAAIWSMMDEVVDDLLKHARTNIDTVYNRELVKKLTYAKARVTGDLDLLLNRNMDETRVTFSLNDRGQWQAIEHETKSKFLFENRTEALKFAEARGLLQEPALAPKLVEDSWLPSGIAADVDDLAPSWSKLRSSYAGTTLPDEVAIGAAKDTLKKPSPGYLPSFFFKPFYPWLDKFSRSIELPELYRKLDLDHKIHSMMTNMDQQARGLRELNNVKKSRRVTLASYLEADPENRANIIAERRITPDELKMLKKIEDDFIPKLEAQTGLDIKAFMRNDLKRARQAAQEGRQDYSSLIRDEYKIFKQAVKSGEMWVKDGDLVKTLTSMMRITNRNAFLDESLDAARTFIKENREQIGSAHALLLNRHLNFVAGTPDISQSILNGVSKTAIDGINNMVDKINLKSPVKIPKIEWTAQEGWGRYMLYSYAAGLGYNIGAVVRDAHQILVTTGPVLGPKYMKKGFAAIEGSWPQIKKRWDFVQKHGGLLEYSELSTLYSGGYEHLQRTRLTKLAERSLKTYQGVNNASRFVSWWGHWKKMQDATRDYYKHQNVQKWLDDSAVGWLDDSQIEKYVKTLQSGSLKQVDDMLPHAATDLSNFSQWNYTRGAHPGLYKFAVGRLLGQYGTWPMNYVEFLKRLTTGGQVSKQARTKALLQMAASHYGMFAGYGAMGIDTASWVFLSPAGYSFSPLFNAGVNVLPAASNWYDDRGDEARKKVLAPLYPMAIPAGNQGKRLLESLFGDSKNPALDILGMKSMDEADTNRMMYSINPGADNDR